MNRFFLTLMFLFGVHFCQAHNLEPLHVDGRYLKNPNGDIVTLHGWLTGFCDYYYEVPEAADETEQSFILWKKTTDDILAAGYKLDYARLHFAGLNGPDTNDPTDFDGCVAYFENSILPRVDYLNEKGIYVLLMCDADYYDVGVNNREIGEPLQQRLMRYWDYVSNHPRIKNNPGVMFELANEPNDFLDSDGSKNNFKTMRNYYQPMVDLIRKNGCQQVIWVPGWGCQVEYSGYAVYPIEGTNIGYAIHAYDWYSFDEGRSSNYDDIKYFWNLEIKLASNMAPIIITETSWSNGHYVDGATTSGLGEGLKRICEEYGNVSWNILPEGEDMVKVNQPSPDGKPAVYNDPEAVYIPYLQWLEDYAKTKYTPVSTLNAASVQLEETHTAVYPGDVRPITLMATFADGRRWNVAGDAVWTSSDESVITVRHGNMHVMKEGMTTIHGKYTDGTGKVFDVEFSVVSSLFPLTAAGIQYEHGYEASYDESTHTFAGTVSCGWFYSRQIDHFLNWFFSCWNYIGGIDMSAYNYLVLRLNDYPIGKAKTAELYLSDNIEGEPKVKIDLFGKKEVVIDLHAYPELDLTKIANVRIWQYGDDAKLSVKEIFLSNDGVTPVTEPYAVKTVVTASDMTMRYGDEVPDLDYTITGGSNVGTPKLNTTATSTSPAGTYDIIAEAGSGADDDIQYLKGRMTVLPALLSVVADDVELYEGDNNSAFNLTYIGLRNGDTEGTAIVTAPTASTEITCHTPSGTYPIIVSGGETNDNYQFGNTHAGTITILEPSIDGTDLTARVGISQDDWHAWGTAIWRVAPRVTTKDGRTALMAETYEGTTEETGERMWQEVTGLPNGDYVVEVFANAVYTPNRGFESSVKEGAEDVAYVEANGQRTYLEAHIGELLPWNGFYRINTTVTNGKLRISMVAEKPGTNWHTIQIKKLIKLCGPDQEPVYKVGDDITSLATAEWEGKTGDYGGLANASVERYTHGTPADMDDILTQTVSGLENGTYRVQLEAAASFTPERGFDCPTGDGLSVVFANNTQRNLPVLERGWVGEGEQKLVTLTATVTDGTLKYGIKNLALSGNWFVARLKSIVYVSTEAQSPKTYAISIAAEENGKTTTDVTADEEGSRVFITATPDEDCTLESLKVTTTGGKEVEVTGNSFIMPASAVTVTATYKAPEPEPEPALLGDANGDGEINVADIVEVVNYILGRPSDIFMWDAADLNGDGEVNVTDIVAIVNIILTADVSSAKMRGVVEVANTENDMVTLFQKSNRVSSLELTNEGKYVASQFDLVLAEGQRLNSITLNEKRANDHSVSYSKVGENTYRVVVYSLSNAAYEGSEGELLNIDVTGDGEYSLENILFVTAQQAEKRFAPLAGEATGINSTIAEKTFDIYSVDGILLYKQATSTEGLPKGVYIIDGKKYLVK